MAPHLTNAAPALPSATRSVRPARASLGMLLCSTGLLLGAGTVGAASPALRSLCVRAWRAGDEVTTWQQSASAAQVSVMAGEPRLPAGVVPGVVETHDAMVVERCREVRSGSSRSSGVRVALSVSGSKNSAWQSAWTPFDLRIEGSEARCMPTKADASELVTVWAASNFGRRPWVDDAVPPILDDVMIESEASSGVLRRESLGTSTCFTATDFDLDSFRGSWWVEEFSERQVLVAYEFEVRSLRPRSNETLGKAGWLTGGAWHVRGAVWLRRDSRLPESDNVLEATCDGCVALGSQLLRVTERMRVWTRVATWTVEPVEEHADRSAFSGAEARWVAVSSRDGGQLGNGLLVEPDVVLTATPILLGARGPVHCARSSGDSTEVTGVAFPKPHADWVLLHLGRPIAPALPKLAPSDADDAATRTGAPCEVLAVDFSGELGPTHARVFRALRSAGTFLVTSKTPLGPSGSPVFLDTGGFLGILTDKLDGIVADTFKATLALGAMGPAPSDLPAPSGQGWTRLSDWQAGLPATARDALLSVRDGRSESLELSALSSVWDQVGAQLAGASSLAGEWFAHRGRARALRGEFDASRADLARADAFAPSRGWARQCAADMVSYAAVWAWVAADTANALEANRTESALRPGQVRARCRLARGLFDAGDEGWKTLVRGLAGDDLPLLDREVMAVWVARAQDTELMELWAKAAETRPSRSGVSAWLRGLRAAREGNYTLANQYFAAARPEPQYATRVAGLAAWALLKEGKFEEAGRRCGEIDLYDPDANAIAIWDTCVIAAVQLKPNLLWTRLRVGLARFPWDKDLLEYAANLSSMWSTGPDARYAPILGWLASR